MEPEAEVQATSDAYGANEDSLAEKAKRQTQAFVDRSVELSEEGKKQLARFIKQAKEYRTHISSGPCGLKIICAGACIAATVLVVMFEVIPNVFHPFELIVSLYAAIFAFIGVILESTTMPCKALDLKAELEIWCKFLSRVWGRGLYYITLALFQFAQQSWVGWMSGALLGVAAILSFIVSIVGSMRLNSVQKKLVAEYGNKGETSIRAAFDAFDKDNSGTLTKTELALATETLGAAFTADQLVEIFKLLDTDKSGSIDYNEFRAWWTSQKDLNYAWV